MVRKIDYEALRALSPGVPRGEKHTNAVLTEKLVREIRELHASGHGYRRIARAVGVSTATVERAVKRLTWAHVK